MEKISDRQKTKIWTFTRKTGLPEERLRDIVERVSGQRSTRELTRREAIRVINILEGTESLPALKGNYKAITPAQLNFIGQLKTEAGWTDEHLSAYLLKFFKQNNIRDITLHQAGVVINVLKKAKHKQRERNL